MILSKYKSGLAAFMFVAGTGIFNTLQAQDVVHYTGTTLSNIDYHHGQLSPAIGVHNIQIMRANREQPSQENSYGWTYNHATNMAYWNNTFFLHYLSDPVGEHIPPSQTLLMTSKDGYNWTKPDIIFPPYKVPDGFRKSGVEGVAKDLYAIMHQRMGFFVSKKDRLLALAYYGIAMDAKDDPNDGKGIGRVVREIYKDGTYGPIYFIRHNSTWDQKKSEYPMFTKSKDKGFVEACRQLLSDPLMMQQWVEEADRDDKLIPLKKQYKALSYYTLPDGRVAGLWKHAVTAISNDGGKTWPENAGRAPGFVNSNAKIWGQRTSDGKYATVYNPSEYRWPLALSVSDDGLNYKNLLLVNGEISPMRYGGNYKSYGPQYIRGILENNGTPPDNNMWLSYSMNKEDIWVAKVPVPVVDKAAQHANDNFNALPANEELKLWNVYSPLWAPVKVEKATDGLKYLTLTDKDRYDYAKAERIIPATKILVAEFDVTAAQNDFGVLDIEFQDGKGTPFARLTLDSVGNLNFKAGSRYKGVLKYEAGKKYTIKATLNTETRMCTINVNGEKNWNGIAFSPVAAIERVVYRTGNVRRFPHIDTPADQTYDLPNAGSPEREAKYTIGQLKTSAQ
ncbi:BNR repeat protein [Arcticibacter pallidicorallinus]|uniref:BNR repeat protein n=1 Tax=Arcticibacter pallidicorallinus TaxID=1259464 RepID=A0A2T0UCP6_9SPHI|nr:exo-alpha-sialidase [Arcticibacter pallidicorallinus]PRY55587.1 BNR repeat protein [Arcticibacter pallidicorallinus]